MYNAICLLEGGFHFHQVSSEQISEMSSNVAKTSDNGFNIVLLEEILNFLLLSYCHFHQL